MSGNRIIPIRLGYVKCFLLQCGEHFLLIDSGPAREWEKFLASIRKIGIDISRIRYILLTHHHNDHTGFAERLRKESGARIIAHPGLYMVRGSAPLNPCNRRLAAIIWLVRFLGRTKNAPVLIKQDDDILIGQDNALLLPSIGIKGIITCLPGHTSDSIGVILNNGLTFCGDAAMVSPRIFGARNRPIIIEDKKAMFESWKKMLSMGARTIVPSHGKEFPADELKRSYNRFCAKYY